VVARAKAARRAGQRVSASAAGLGGGGTGAAAWEGGGVEAPSLSPKYQVGAGAGNCQMASGKRTWDLAVQFGRQCRQFQNQQTQQPAAGGRRQAAGRAYRIPAGHGERQRARATRSPQPVDSWHPAAVTCGVCVWQ
jgi:hypothetical protein